MNFELPRHDGCDTELSAKTGPTRNDAATGQAAKMQAVILDALPAHIALLDATGMILVVNASWRKFGTANGLHGPSFGTGQNYLEICDSASGRGAEEARAAAAGIRRVLRREIPGFFLEYPCHSPTKPRWFQMTATPLDEGRGAGAVVAHADITERKLANAAVRESEERFRATFEQAAVGIAHVSLEGSFLRVNQKLCDIVGFTRNDLLRLTFSDLTLSENLAEADGARHAMLTGARNSWSTEMRCRLGSGGISWVKLITKLVREASGEPQYFLSVIEDISDRKQAEMRLRRLNRLYAVLNRIGESIARSHDRQELYDAACRIVVEDGLLPAALVVEVSEGLIRKAASFGGFGDCREGLMITPEDSPAGRGTIGTAIRTGRHDVCNDFAADPRMAPGARPH